MVTTTFNLLQLVRSLEGNGASRLSIHGDLEAPHFIFGMSSFRATDSIGTPAPVVTSDELHNIARSLIGDGAVEEFLKGASNARHGTVIEHAGHYYNLDLSKHGSTSTGKYVGGTVLTFRLLLANPYSEWETELMKVHEDAEGGATMLLGKCAGGNGTAMIKLNSRQNAKLKTFLLELEKEQ